MKDYIDKLIELRVDQDKKQIELAKILNITQSTYSKYERRESNLTIKQLRTLCIYYKVSADWILNIPANNEN